MRLMHNDVDVKLVRWPAEQQLRERLQLMGIPRILVIEGGCNPPTCRDTKEDWVRAPVSRADLEARMATLRTRTRVDRVPEVDPIGVVRFLSKSTAVSPTEADLLECLSRRFGEVVSRDDLAECLPERNGSRRNALDLHIMRMRRRIRPLGLVIRTVWGQGYLLEPLQA